MATATFVALALVAFGLYWASDRSDAVSTARQFRTTRQAIDLSVSEIERQQQTVAAWDDPIVKLSDPVGARAWLDENIGVWLHDLFGHDEVYILDGSDRPVYAMRRGVGAAAGSFEDRRASLSPFVTRVRAQIATHRAATQEEGSKTPRPPHYSDLAMVAGQPAAVSVMKMVPLTPAFAQGGGGAPLLVSVRYFGGSFLGQLTRDDLIEAPRFGRIAQAAEGEAMVPLSAKDGTRIGYFFWKPELPGRTVLATLVPVTALAAIGMVSMMVLLAYWLLRGARALQNMLVELRASEAQAQHLAFHDVLTGLPNRALFNDRLDHALVRARRGEGSTLLLLDLDRFKHVNDTFGHLAGDALIREFGNRLSFVLREEDTVARIGGDEFGVLLPGLIEAPALDDICRRIIEAVHRPFEVVGHQAFVGVSIGVVQAPQNSTDRTELMRKADIALYGAKDEGRDRYRLFDASMDETVKLRGTIEEDLRLALETGKGLEVHYQPLVGMDGAVVGLEALMRWDRPQHGIVSPEQAIPVAEETGLIVPLGEWVLREACSVAALWPDLFVAVNLSPRQFRAPAFVERALEIVCASGARPEQIELEVTESILIDDDVQVHAALARLRAAGLRVALDDFGTGYSSLSYLRRFEVDKIKIDRSFVQHLGNNADSGAIVQAVVTLGHAMGLTVTAEGVETGDQQAFLKVAGCNQMQGFLFSRPIPARDLFQTLQAVTRHEEAA